MCVGGCPRSLRCCYMKTIGKAPYLSEHSGRSFLETRHWKNHTNSRLVLDPSRSQRTCRISFFSFTLLQSVCASSQVAVSSGPDRLKSCSLLDVCGGLFTFSYLSGSFILKITNRVVQINDFSHHFNNPSACAAKRCDCMFSCSS